MIRSMAHDGSVLVRDATPHEILVWDQIVSGFSGCRITHKRAWLDSLEDSVGGRALYLLVEKWGEIVGCLPGLLITKGFVRIFGSPLPGWQTVSMGPLSDAERITTRELTAAVVEHLERNHRVQHIELMTSGLDSASMTALHFRGEPVVTFTAPLVPGDEAAMLMALKPNARRNVRRAMRLGLVTRFEEDERFVDEAYDQIQEVFTGGGNTVSFSKNRALQFFRQMKKAGALRAISVSLPQDQVKIATGLFTVDGGELLLWQWAHRRAYRWYRPTEFMTWTVMLDAMKHGCTTFDLMGGGTFKAHFGAAPDTTKFRWVRSRYRYLAGLRTCAQVCFRVQQRVRGGMARLGQSFIRPASEPMHEPDSSTP